MLEQYSLGRKRGNFEIKYSDFNHELRGLEAEVGIQFHHLQPILA